LSRRVLAADPRKGADIDFLALQLIERYQPEVLAGNTAFDVEKFFEFDLEDLCGVKVDYRELPSGIYGVTDSERKECIISAELMDRPRKSDKYFARSTIAHEGYHAMVHIPEFRKKRAVLKSINDEQHASLCLYRQEDVPIYMNPEWQAFRFAGALLMPEEPFKASIRNGYGVRDLADLFQANPANVCSRAKALSILLK